MTHASTRLVSVTFLGLSLSCGAQSPTPEVPTPPPEPIADVAPPEPSTWFVPQRAVRGEDASGWDPITRTYVIISASGHLVLVDGATGLVRAVERFARRADDPSLVIGAGRGLVFYQSSDGESGAGTIDLTAGTVDDLDYGHDAIASANAATLATWWDQERFVQLERVDGEDADSCAQEVPGEEGTGWHVSLSPDGKLSMIVTGTHVSIVDIRECSESRAFELTAEPVGQAIFDDGGVAFLMDTTHVELRDASGAPRSTLELPRACSQIAFMPDGRTIVGWGGSARVAMDLETRAVSRLADDALGAAFTPRIDPEMPSVDASGGEHAFHVAAIRPDAEGIVIGQREGSMVVTRDGVSLVDCLDGETEISWSPLEPGVALQGSDGQCNVQTSEGSLPTPEPGYGSYGYDQEEDDEEEEEAEPEPQDEVVCAPTDPSVCVTYPARGHTVRLSTGPGRGRVLRGGDDGQIEFSTAARYLALRTSTALRIVDVATARDVVRAPAGSVVDWGPDDHWVITQVEGGGSTFRSLADTHLALEVARTLAGPESIVFDATGATALLCSPTGIDRISLTDGALTALSTTPCETIRVFGDHAVVRAHRDEQFHVVDLVSGRVLLDFDASAQPPPAGSSFFYACSDADRTVVDVAHGTMRTVIGACGHTATSEDGSYWISQVSFESLTLGRTDGETLAVHVLWVDGEPHAYAEHDGTFWVATPDEVGLLNVVVQTGEDIAVTSASDPEMQRRFYRPTLLADFLDGRPLP
jgi:hypothetical protein